MEYYSENPYVSAAFKFYSLNRACVCAQSCPLLASVWAVTRQAPVSLRFSRRERQSRLLFPPPGNLPDPGVQPASLVSPALAGRFFTSRVTRDREQDVGLCYWNN